MTSTVLIPVQRLTPESFAPYGEVLTLRDEPPDFRGTMSIGWQSHFQVTGDIAIYTLLNLPSGFSFSKLERHFDVTQTFIPVGMIPFVVAVAPPTDDSPPDPANVRGFLVDGTAGYLLNRGTWHSLDRYPLHSENLTIVMITGQRTQEDITRNPPGEMELSEQVDYAARSGVTFKFDISGADMTPP